MTAGQTKAARRAIEGGAIDDAIVFFMSGRNTDEAAYARLREAFAEAASRLASIVGAVEPAPLILLDQRGIPAGWTRDFFEALQARYSFLLAGGRS